MTTIEELDSRLREIPLLERLDESWKMIGEMCKNGKPPKMSIPVQWDDEDQYIAVSLRDAMEEIARLRAELEAARVLSDEVFQALHELWVTGDMCPDLNPDKGCYEIPIQYWLQFLYEWQQAELVIRKVESDKPHPQR